MTFFEKVYAPEETHPHDGNLVRMARGSFGASNSPPHANSCGGLREVAYGLQHPTRRKTSTKETYMRGKRSTKETY